MILWTMLACSGDPGTPADTDVDSDTPPVEQVEPPPSGVVKMETRDGVKLTADVLPGDPGAPGFVLLHMGPPNDRTNWPDEFREQLNANGWWVVALDRRGAGDSKGNPQEAAFGPNGKYDVEAAAILLRDAGAGPLAVIGASNGTTTLLDYAAWAPGEDLPPVAAAGFMTGDTYTEFNTPFTEMPEVPAVFTYSTAERDWSVAQQEGAPASWVFHEYADGRHGTAMFDVAPEVADDLEAFFLSVL